MDSVFSEELLADKLSKLNGTQQRIESLSHWCMFHRGKAELVVEIWDKQFHNTDMLQKIPLLYLANDILQNSKRKGNKFVTEFWKVLPAAIKIGVEIGDDRGKNAVSRLVNIWEERKVFGSRARSLKEKSSIGGAAEKIVSAFHLVFSEQSTEEAEISNCKSSVCHVRKMEKDVDIAFSISAEDPKRKTLAKEIEDEENLLKQSIEKLRSIESSRVALVSLLKEALHEQESGLEGVRTQMQVAQEQVEEASNMRRRFNGEEYVSKASTATVAPINSNA